jgi:hypothetical protein
MKINTIYIKDLKINWFPELTDEQILSWLQEHNITIIGEGVNGYVESLRFEIAYDRPQIQFFVSQYGHRWTEKYLPFMKTINQENLSKSNFEAVCEVVRDIYEGREPNHQQELKVAYGFNFKGADKLKKLTKLFKELKGVAIQEEDSDLSDFIKVFSYEEIKKEIKITWLLTAGDLAYFFEQLIARNYLGTMSNYNAILKDNQYFVDEFQKPFINLKGAKFSYTENSQGKPKNYLSIDKILNKINA